MSAVVVLTLVTMVVEIVMGYWTGSMALLADGWHMASHAAALGVAAFAYRFARLHAKNPRYSFGTGKVGDLAAFTSSLMLGVVAVFMIIESIARLRSPVPVGYSEAIAVAVLGLVVNLVSAWLLQGDHDHHHDHDHDSDHDHGHEHHHDHDHDHGNGHEHTDHNLAAAYVHVLTDALTSILAIVALLAGSYAQWTWLDPVMGIVGGIVIARWAWALARRTAAVLLDAGIDLKLAQRVQQRLKDADAEVEDLHLWRLAPGKFAVIASLSTHAPRSPSEYKARLADLPQLVHITVEVETVSPP